MVPSRLVLGEASTAEGLEPGFMKEHRLWNSGAGFESLLPRMPCAPALNSACRSAAGGAGDPCLVRSV